MPFTCPTCPSRAVPIVPNTVPTVSPFPIGEISGLWPRPPAAVAHADREAVIVDEDAALEGNTVLVLAGARRASLRFCRTTAATAAACGAAGGMPAAALDMWITGRGAALMTGARRRRCAAGGVPAAALDMGIAARRISLMAGPGRLAAAKTEVGRPGTAGIAEIAEGYAAPAIGAADYSDRLGGAVRRCRAPAVANTSGAGAAGVAAVAVGTPASVFMAADPPADGCADLRKLRRRIGAGRAVAAVLIEITGSSLRGEHRGPPASPAGTERILAARISERRVGEYAC